MASLTPPYKHPILRRIWRIVRWPLLAIVLIYVAGVVWDVIYRQPTLMKSAATVAKIHAERLVFVDIDGKHLPPAPDPTLNNSTLAGIDENGNGIRDDVELAIFQLHPYSEKIRAAELQYAMELQNEMTNVFDSATLVATMQEESRGDLCLADTVSTSSNNLKTEAAILQSRVNEVQNLTFDDDARKNQHEEIFQYMTSYANLKGPNCDLDLSSLPN